MYVITGKQARSQGGKAVKVYRKTKADALKHARLAREFGGVNVRVKKVRK